MRNSVLIPLLVLLLTAPLTASAQPVWAPGDMPWNPLDGDIDYWEQADGDSMVTYQAANGTYGRAQEDGEWTRYHCPGMVEGDYWTLGATTDSLSAAQQVVSSVVTEGDGSVGTGMVGEMLECIDAFQQHLDTLDISDLPREKGWTYATECVTSVWNATLHIPGSTALAEDSDTVAVYKNGFCVGWGVWNGGATLAAAGMTEFNDGYAEDDTIRLEVYDISEGVAYRKEVAWASCTETDQPICAEGLYADGTYHEVTQ